MKYRPEIDGLRAVAVLPVVLFHAGVPGFAGGYLGVDVFFVISGFLITSIVAGQIDRGTFSFVTFYERRLRRLMPALFAMMAGVLAMGLFVSLPGDLSRMGMQMVAVCLYLSNLVYCLNADYFAAASELDPLLHTWSLSVEEQFYMLFPAFLVVATALMPKRVRGTVALLGLLSLLFSLSIVNTHSSLNFFLPISRAWELLVGVWLALSPELVERLRAHPKVRTALAGVGLTSIAASMALFDHGTPNPSLFTLAPVLGTALVLACASPHEIVGRSLALKPLVYVGLISYPLYLWHQPLLAFSRQASIGAASPLLLAAAVGLSVVLADLSWRYLEKPFRSPELVSRRTIFSMTALGSVLCMITGAGLLGSHGLPGRLSPEVQGVLVQGQRNSAFDDCLLRPGDALDEACRLGAPDARVTLALVGDSHATMFAPELDARLRAAGIGGVMLAVPMCTPVEGVTNTYPKNFCAEHTSAVFDWLEQHPEVETLLVSGRWSKFLAGGVGYDRGDQCAEPGNPRAFTVTGLEHLDPLEAARAALSHTLGRLDAMNKNVVVMLPVPPQGCDVPKALAKSLRYGVASPPPLSRTAEAQRSEHSRTLLTQVSRQNLSFVDPRDALCDDAVCRWVTEDGEPLYVDDDHLSDHGVREIFDHTELQALLLGTDGVTRLDGCGAKNGPCTDVP